MQINNEKLYFNDAIRISKQKNKKTKIILLNTGCSLSDHFTKLAIRYSESYNKIPTFTISLKGVIYQHFDINYHTRLLDQCNLDKQSITIALENVGWLNYNQEGDFYTDWCNHAYVGNVVKIRWKNKNYWAEYTEKQIIALIELIDYLCIESSINKNFIGSNVFMSDAVNFNGILNRSNLNKSYYDLTPAMDFNKITQIINNSDDTKYQ